MKLLTKQIIKSLPAIGETDGNDQAKAVVKFFHPCRAFTYYVFEANAIIDRENEYLSVPLRDCRIDGDSVFIPGDGAERLADDVMLFGIADLHEREIGYQSLRELRTAPIERDLYYRPQTKQELLGW